MEYDIAAEKKMNLKKEKSIRSPLFYVGDKYKLMPQLKQYFPLEIENYYDVFCGGGSASINVEAKAYYMNDSDKKIIELHDLLQRNAVDMPQFISKMHFLIEKYDLSLSEKGLNETIKFLRKEHIKTYYARYNKNAYLKLRDDYNTNQNDTELLYLLLIYGFNHMVRFNSDGKFNLPVGNVDWNKNVSQALRNYSDWYINKRVFLSEGQDFSLFVNRQEFSSGDFLYFDPPYLITFSDYNKLWKEEDEHRLYDLLDELDCRGIKWGLSNMLTHKGKTNEILQSWATKYKKFKIDSNYISRFDNTIKNDSEEIYVTNC